MKRVVDARVKQYMTYLQKKRHLAHDESKIPCFGDIGQKSRWQTYDNHCQVCDCQIHDKNIGHCSHRPVPPYCKADQNIPRKPDDKRDGI